MTEREKAQRVEAAARALLVRIQVLGVTMEEVDLRAALALPVEAAPQPPPDLAERCRALAERLDGFADYASTAAASRAATGSLAHWAGRDARTRAMREAAELVRALLAPTSEAPREEKP